MLNEQGKEIVLIRTTGGPVPGNRFVTLDQPEIMCWPPPEVLPNPGGFGYGIYKRIRMSDLPSEVCTHPNITRGAEYVWVDQNHLYN